MSLYGRSVVLEVGVPGQEGLRIDELRITFDVEHKISSDPATARITVYNPTRETIAAFQAEGVLVRLAAGYGFPVQIFQGSPVAGKVTATKRGPDRVLQITAQDGGRELLETQLDISYARPVSLAELVEVARSALAVPRGVSVTIDETVTFPSYAFSGDARVLLDRLAEVSGAYWHIRDGALTFVSTTGDTGETAAKYSSEAGNLVGSPARKSDQLIEVVALLDASMRPGRPFVVQSADLSGIYVAQVVRFSGDSGFGGPFYTICEGVAR
jgi:hypothetical protein